MNTGPVGLFHLVLVCVSLSVPHLSQGADEGLWQEPQLNSENVGCLFSDQVCNDEEICFNDLVFGRCISTSSSDEDLTRFQWLSEPELGQLEVEMDRVFGLGFSWPDLYTQCTFQTLLHCIKNSHPYTRGTCDDLLEAQLQEQLQQQQQQVEEERQEDQGEAGDYSKQDVQRDGWAGFDDPPGFGYYPGESQLSFISSPVEEDIPALSQDVNSAVLQLPPADEDADSFPPSSGAAAFLETPSYFQRDLRSARAPLLVYPDQVLSLNSPPELLSPQTVYPVASRLFIPPSDPDNNNNNPSNLPYPIYREDQDNMQHNLYPDYQNLRNVPEQPQQDYDDLILPVDHRDTDSPPDMSELRTNYRQRRNHDDTNDGHDDDGREDYDKTDDAEPETLLDALYHDQIVDRKQPPDYDFVYEEEANNDAEPLYYNMEDGPIPIETVFNRKERLDVKKPGPFFQNSPNSFFLDKLIDETSDDQETPDNTDEDLPNTQQQNQDGQTEYEMPLTPPGSRPKKDFAEKVVAEYESEPAPNKNYLHINIKDRFKTLAEGLDKAGNLVNFLADKLQVPPDSFAEPSIARSNHLAVEVFSNPRQLDAAAMAAALGRDNDLRVEAKRAVGVDIDDISAGQEGDGVVSSPTDQADHNHLVVLIFLLVAAITSLLLIAAVIFIIRQRRKTTKVEEDDTIVTDIANNKEEPVAEYKQLCRDWSRSSRASAGSNGGKEENGGSTPVINSPPKQKLQHKNSGDGSRTSSTSSWHEEPGVTSMDISTGHMVLAYMEDHLKNKQRLEQEWVGLCAYEAEPSATSIAFKVENKKKNRYPDKLPFDHNRVLLNPLTNGSNSDYINASTVTDHDPRNPAYIVTQGPLAHTAADFWQMVWEQGSVVIVMLTKLQENGYNLAHRYWPEEGSEQYHIFEVHLVSEHVWCDDYMVRSVYLRNTQTGETRTVTQFHFSSWPDTGVPASTKALLEFRRKVNKSYRGRSCPIIVHCSDGVGRSGTYILIDMVLNRMTKGSKEIDIAATLEHIRDQRSGMVQSRTQFEFCLMAVAEETHAILKSLPQ